MMVSASAGFHGSGKLPPYGRALDVQPHPGVTFHGQLADNVIDAVTSS